MTDCTATDRDIFHARSEPIKGPQIYSFSLGLAQYVIVDHAETSLEQNRLWDPSYSTDDFIFFTVALSGYCRCVPNNNKQVSDRKFQTFPTFTLSRIKC